jgi:TPR repeat protein
LVRPDPRKRNRGAEQLGPRPYARGLGLTRDYALAHMWFSLAAAQGFSDATDARDELTSKMTAAELTRAQALAAEWKPKN